MNKPLINGKADWKPCSSGEISDFFCRIRHHRRNVISKRIGASAALVLFVVLLLPAVSSLRNQIRGKTTGFTCNEIEDFAVEYLAGGLTPQIRDEIDKHLAKCPGCNALLNGLRQEKTMRPRMAIPHHNLKSS